MTKDIKRLMRKIRQYARAYANLTWAGSFPLEEQDEIVGEYNNAKAALTKELEYVEQEMSHEGWSPVAPN